MKSSQDEFPIARVVRTLKSQRAASESLSEEAYQCLFAIRLLLDVLSKEKGTEDAQALQVAEKAVTQLSEAVSRYSGQQSDIDFLLREIECLNLEKAS